MQHGFMDNNSDKTISVFVFNSNNNNKLWSERRIDLGLIKKIIVYLTPEKIHTYEPPTDKLVKIIIKGDESEIKAIMKLEKIKELKKRGVKIAFKTIGNNNDNTNEKKGGPILKMRYRDRLYSEIRKDKDQLKRFELLCK